MKFLIISILLTSNALAFTLSTNVNAGFKSDRVNIHVTSNSSCSNAGITTDQLVSIIDDAVTKFWNTIPSSYLRLKSAGITTSTDSRFITGELCANNITESCIPKVTEIIVACNTDSIKNFPSANYFAVSAPNNISGSEINGSVILINDSTNSNFKTLTHEEMVNVLGHEIGHAIGIGHTPDSAALMYYTDFANRHNLSQDDIDAATYLYPNKLSGCTGIFGTIKDHSDKGNGPFLFSLGLGFLFIFSILGILRRNPRIESLSN